MAIGRQLFLNAGARTDTIDVKISHKIIKLFSEGLYSSPIKALEELVSNSFDANAYNVHVILSPDLRESNASIVVIDDGEGMDISGLRQHWIIGRSTRRNTQSSSARKPIGKFGIGKLATYVLADKLTHICKLNGKIYAATMDYGELGQRQETDTAMSDNGSVFSDEGIQIPVRELTEHDAIDALKEWTTGTKPGYKALKLFGKNASESWTVAIMSDLTDMGKTIKWGRLRWLLSVAMPLRDDFKLYFNGIYIVPSKVDKPVSESWIIGKDITADNRGAPCPDGFEVTMDENVSEESIDKYGLFQAELGRITGYVELYEDELTGRSDEIERSNGFFVYVRGRLINIDDPGFGIERNLLRHGTFSRLRVVVNIESLDEELRSSRESLRQDLRYNLAKDFLRSVFNLARNRLDEHEKSKSPGSIIAERISSAPGSITRKPLLSLLRQAIEGKAKPLYVELPDDLTATRKKYLLEKIEKLTESDEGLIQSTEFVESSSDGPLATYDFESTKLIINLFHPFIASFYDEFIGVKSGTPLKLLLASEVLLEAHLYYTGISEDKIKDILAERDELLRHLARRPGRRNQYMISLALLDARNDDKQLEKEMVAAFEAMGFDGVVPLGKAGKPDGTADAFLPGTEDGEKQRYRVGLEAKSGKKVSSGELKVSTLIRHMNAYQCDHHLVIGNEFTDTSEGKAIYDEIKEGLRGKNKTITLMYIEDLAKLVRLVPAKRVSLTRLRDLFMKCITPEESKTWVKEIDSEISKSWPYREILEVIWKLSADLPYEPIRYQTVSREMTHLTPPIMVDTKDVKDCCSAMAVMAKGVVFARNETVEISRRPDLILEDIRSSLDNYPEDEKLKIVL